MIEFLRRRLSINRNAGLFPIHGKALVLFVCRIVSALLSYGIYAIIARTTSKDTYDGFALIFSLVHFVGPLAGMGQSLVIIKHLPLVHDLSVIRKRILDSIRIVYIGLLLTAPFTIVFLHSQLNSATNLTIVFASGALVAFVIGDLLSSIWRGIGSVVGAAFGRDLIWRIALFLLVLISFTRTDVVSLTWVSGDFCISLTLAMIIMAGFVLPRIIKPSHLVTSCSSVPLSEWLFYLGLTAIEVSFWNVDVLILTAMGVDDVGGYFTAQRIAQTLYLIPASAIFVAAPHVSSLFYEGKSAEVQRLSHDISCRTGLVVAFLVGLIFLMSPSIMQLFGARFADRYYLLDILSLSPLISAVGGLHATIPTMCGLQQSYFIRRLSFSVLFIAIKTIAAMTGSLSFFAIVSVLEATTVTILGVMLARRVGIRLGAIV